MSIALQFLIGRQNPDGGWGYLAGHPSMVEPTSAVCLALASVPGGVDAYQRGLAWLSAAQNHDGGWGLCAGDHESGWHTAWAAMALAKSGSASPAALVRASQRLLASAVSQGAPDAEDPLGLRIDTTLLAWPFLPGQAAWVEPTALSLLALDALGIPGSTGCVAQGVLCLMDRRCENGGWNFGNPYMLDAPLPARAEPTALALLALARWPLGVVAPQDVDALRHSMATERGILGLALGCLALRAIGQEYEDSVRLVTGKQLADGSWGANVFHTAAALAALRA